MTYCKKMQLDAKFKILNIFAKVNKIKLEYMPYEIMENKFLLRLSPAIPYNIAIYRGSLIFDISDIDILWHEFCHILIVEPNLRQYMTGDTVASYKNINRQYAGNHRKESITLGIQSNIYEKYNFKNIYLHGQFFSGQIRTDLGEKDDKHDLLAKNNKIKTSWKDIADSLSHIVWPDL